jgi:hypothetical protein
MPARKGQRYRHLCTKIIVEVLSNDHNTRYGERSYDCKVVWQLSDYFRSIGQKETYVILGGNWEYLEGQDAPND